MRPWIVRFASLCLLFAALALPVNSQDLPTVTIAPDAGEVEIAVFDIEIAGLDAETSFTVEILFAGEVVFSSDETSDADGKIPYPVSSTEGDPPGIYTIRVVHDDDVIVSADFELTPAAADDEPEREFLGEVTVSPETVPFGRLQTLRIAELDAQTEYTVEITASESLQVAYRRLQKSDDDGVIEIELFAEEGDGAGHHEIAVYDADGQLIAEGEFTIAAPLERDVIVTLRPDALAAGGIVEIAVSGLAAFDSVSAQISSADDVTVDTVLARASSDGEASLSFATASDLAEGVYAVVIFVEGEETASAEFSVGNADAPTVAAQISIDPPSGAIGSEHVIAVRGLAAEQTFELIILDPNGAEEYRKSRAADADGGYSLTISSTEDDDLGSYTVEIRADESDDLLASATFDVTGDLAAEAAASEAATGDAVSASAPADESATEASATIEPQAAPIGSSHLITVRQLAPSELVTIDVVFAGESVYQTEKTADADGTVTLELYTSDEDEPGDYTITVLREAGVQPRVVLTAEAKGQTIVTATVVGDTKLIQGNLIGGRADLEFDGVAGQVVLITVASEDFDSAAALISREELVIALNDDSRGQKNAMIGPLILPYSGEYALEITATPLMMARGAEIGDFTVRIEPVTVTDIALGTAVGFALGVDTPVLYFALPVETGDSFDVTVDSDGALDTLMQVVAPSGFEYAFDDDSGSGFDAELSKPRL